MISRNFPSQIEQPLSKVTRNALIVLVVATMRGLARVNRIVMSAKTSRHAASFAGQTIQSMKQRQCSHGAILYQFFSISICFKDQCLSSPNDFFSNLFNRIPEIFSRNETFCDHRRLLMVFGSMRLTVDLHEKFF